MQKNTEQEFKEVIKDCKEIFNSKRQQYGDAWRILRINSMNDQLYIKAKRIRSIEEKSIQQVGDSIASEYQGIINYCIIAIILIGKGNNYDAVVDDVLDLLKKKNHEYDEVWRDIYPTSITDFILMKIYRLRKICTDAGEIIQADSIFSIYQDIINYCVFALIKIG